MIGSDPQPAGYLVRFVVRSKICGKKYSYLKELLC